MDLSMLSLPLRRDRTNNAVFNVTPSLTSVNVSYETATVTYDHDNISASCHVLKADSNGSEKLSSAIARESPDSIRETPTNSSTDEASGVSITDTKSFHSRTRSSISLASVECQNFLATLKEPKYAKPLSPDEIGWIFQDFYVKLKHKILGSDDELLTQEEQETRKELETKIDSILDRCEKAVTTGELHSKLFHLGGSYDSELQSKVNAVRSHPEIMDQLINKLELSHNEIESGNLDPAIAFLSLVNVELSPKSKISALVKALQAIVDTFPKDNSTADSIFPLFVLSLAKSTMQDWWKNFMYMQRFRRSSELIGQASYALTSFEAAIRVIEELTLTDVPGGVDAALFLKPLVNPRVINRNRSSSQSSKASLSVSNTSITPLAKRIEETFNSCKEFLASSRKITNPGVDPKFLNADVESLTLADVRVLLQKYKKLAEYVESQYKC